MSGAGDLLEKRTKDVVLAAYLAHALHTTGGLDGLSTGLALFADLLDTYWDTAFPEVKRIIRSITFDEAKMLVRKAMGLSTAAEIRHLVGSVMHERFPDLVAPDAEERV